MELLNLCVENNYFELEGKIYRQDVGMAMGSPLSPIFANIFMEEFEQKAINSATFKPEVWLRYVDDTFAIWRHGQDRLNEFTDHINNISPTIKFTSEIEKNNQLAFLDVNVSKCGSGLKTSVYRKKTHTGKYLNFNSNHCSSVKEGVAYSLFDRAKNVCEEKTALNQEIKVITNDLKNNGYPQKTINKCKRDRKSCENRSEVNIPEKPSAYISVPYVPNLSEKIRRIARKYNIKTAFKTQNTLRQHLSKTKPRNGEQESKNCIYSIPCECKRQYIGETKRPLKIRLNEHKTNINKGDTVNSKLAKHAWEKEHRINWEGVQILHKETHFYKRKFIEAALINISDNPISQSSLEVRPLWSTHLKSHFENKPPLRCNLPQIASTERTHSMTLRTRNP